MSFATGIGLRESYPCFMDREVANADLGRTLTHLLDTESLASPLNYSAAWAGLRLTIDLDHLLRHERYRGFVDIIEEGVQYEG
jgi:hypothetical protein